jgi:hypothetical protein
MIQKRNFIINSALGCQLPETVVCENSRQYGSRWLVAKHCGLGAPPREIHGEWQHGWQPEYMNWHPEGVVGTNGISRHARESVPQFVARGDQELALRGFGYTKAHAVGHPIVYLDSPEIERVPNSLLVMPVHSLASTNHHWDFDEYADAIAAESSGFDHVVACISPNCIEKGYWVDAFLRRGIEVVSGAGFLDKNAYLRMALLFKRFEYTTTNGYGSHLAYAQFFGSKVSLFGPRPTYRRVDYVKDPFYMRCPELLDFVLDPPMHERVVNRWPFLSCHPREGGADICWAEEQLGKGSKRDPEFLMDAFGWRTERRFRSRAIDAVRKLRSFCLSLSNKVLLPSMWKQEKTLSALMEKQGGEERKVLLKGFEYVVKSGSEAAREFRLYSQDCIANVITNPPDSPFFDLVGGSGVALSSYARFHSQRTVIVLLSTEENCPVEVNARALGLDNVEFVRRPGVSIGADRRECCETVRWFASEENKALLDQIVSVAGIIRVRLCKECFESFFESCNVLNGLSLLVMEWIETEPPSISPVCRSLNRLGFAIDSERFRFVPIMHNRDLAASLTCFAAIRFGDYQRSSFRRDSGAGEGLDSGAGARRGA